MSYRADIKSGQQKLIGGLTPVVGITGRVLLGIYFLVPGIGKIINFQGNVDYMQAHGMVMIPFFLFLTIIIQLAGASAMIAGYKIRSTAFILAVLTLVISLVMHDFWNLEAGIEQAHETQNFVKNLAIMAGLMAIAGSKYTLAFSLDNAFKSKHL